MMSQQSWDGRMAWHGLGQKGPGKLSSLLKVGQDEIYPYIMRMIYMRLRAQATLGYLAKLWVQLRKCEIGVNAQQSSHGHI